MFLESHKTDRAFITIPLRAESASLKSELQRLADLECSSLAATARRLLAVSVRRELARMDRDGSEGPFPSAESK